MIKLYETDRWTGKEDKLMTGKIIFLDVDGTLVNDNVRVC